MDDKVKDIIGDTEYDTDNWQSIRTEAEKDMRFVSGNPWDEDDLKIRKNRPTVAPEEMSQYRNQVVNGLMANPRGAIFSPKDNGANDDGAEFYQNKWREIEYRSHGAQQYLICLDNALQRSYGFLRVKTDYASPRSANQDISLEAFPDPDMVLPDTDAKQLDGSDMKRCTVKEWLTAREFKKLYPKAKAVSVDGLSAEQKHWVAGDKVLRAEAWRIETRARKLQLFAVQPPSMTGQPPAPPQYLQLFEDEAKAAVERHPGLTFSRDLRPVDYPSVKVYMTNGIEILDESDWAGQYIPIVPCYGKVLYVPKGGESKKVLLSLTRFGRDPWKSYCYACSQELEVLSMVPKSSLLAVEGQFAGYEQDLQDSYQIPKAFIYYKNKVASTPEGASETPPQPIVFPGGQYLQSLEVVKEGFRRAIQAAMGSNFLPTQAGRINDKSGKALDKIDEVATQGTYHFVYAYESMIRRAAMIGEDLIDKIYDYQGETATRTADNKTQMAVINTPGHKDNVDTQGDYGVTISTAPSTDSERDAASDFTTKLLEQLPEIANVSGPKVAAAVLAISIRMRAPQLGVMAEKLADLIEPPEFKTEDGQPPDPRLMAAQGQIQQLTQKVQQLEQEKAAKIATVQAQTEGKLAVTQLQTTATSQDKAADREVKLVVAELGAKVDRMALLLEASDKIGVRLDAQHEAVASRAHEALVSGHEHAHDRVAQAKDHLHAHVQNELDRQQALRTAAMQTPPVDASGETGQTTGQ